MPIVSIMVKCRCCKYKIIYWIKDRYGNLRFVCEEHNQKKDSYQAYGFDKTPALFTYPEDRIL